MTLQYFAPGKVKLGGKEEEYVRFSMEHQLLDGETWRKFVQVFRADSDVEDNGWRCEYWGKMMRGAALTYMYTGDEALYEVLKAAVEDLLTAQREDGRFSTYPRGGDLTGWDLWGRKYVLTGMLHFYRICKEDDLKERILTALCRHADALLAEVGAEEGKADITQTSQWWGGVNSCSILEPMLDLYKVTGREEYLRFGEYILSTGGCRDGNLIELAHEGKVMPYMYPEVKAYETMSFFEGVLAYYEVTGKEYYLETVLRFVEAVAETDITLIGCSGCTHELFDHSALRQTEWSDVIMQETCVTVTWMRLMARLHLFTGEWKYMERMECSAYNALYGAVNTALEKQLSRETGIWLEPMPFDSYSPLYDNQRGVGVGGYKEFAFGGYYGCCACIASAGTAIYPLTAVLAGEKSVTFNEPLGGDVTVGTGTWHMESAFPERLMWTAKLSCTGEETYTLRVRVPGWAEKAQLTVNGGGEYRAEDGYFAVTRLWQDGDEVCLSGGISLRTVSLNGRTAFLWGPLVLSRDAAKEEGDADLSEEVTLRDLTFRMLPAEKGELVRLTLPRAEGGWMLLTDYASCGKHWREKKCRISPWLNIRFA